VNFETFDMHLNFMRHGRGSIDEKMAEFVQNIDPAHVVLASIQDQGMHRGRGKKAAADEPAFKALAQLGIPIGDFTTIGYRGSAAIIGTEGGEMKDWENHDFNVRRQGASMAAAVIALSDLSPLNPSGQGQYVYGQSQSLVEVGSKGPSTMGQFVEDQKTTVDGELADIDPDYVNELKSVEATRQETVKRATEERDDRETIDQDRVDDAVAAYTVSSAALTAAKTRKDKALADHLHDAQMMGDAKKTQTDNQPLVDAEKISALAANKALFEQVKMSNKDKLDDANKYLKGELKMVKDVQIKVDGTLDLDRSTFIEMAQKALAHHASTLGSLLHSKRRWNFGLVKSIRAADTNQDAGLDYLKRGASKKNEYTTTTGTIGEVLKANSDRIQTEIALVSKSHNNAVKSLTEKRHDELVRSLKARNALVNAETANVDAAQKTYKEKKEAQEAQHGERQTKRKALNAAQGVLDVAKKDQGTARAEASTKKMEEDKASLEHHNAWMDHYTSEETRATMIITREQGILKKVRGIIEDADDADAASAVTVNKCVAEKKEYDEATKAARAQQDVCNEATVEAAHDNAKLLGDVNVKGKDDGEDTTVTVYAEADKGDTNLAPMYKSITSGHCDDQGLEYILDKKQCTAALKAHTEYENWISGTNRNTITPHGCYWHPKKRNAYFSTKRGPCTSERHCICIVPSSLALSAKKKCSLAAALAEQAKEEQQTYNTCLAKGASALTQALIEVQRLSQKYIGDTKKFNAANQGDYKVALQALSKLDASLERDLAAMKKSVKADRDAEGTTRSTKDADSLKKFQAVLLTHKNNVAGKSEARNGARDAHRAEDVKWQTAQTAQDTAESNLRQAEGDAVETKEAAEKAKLDADTRSENFYSTEKTKADQIRLEDDTYLKKEYAAIGDIQKFVEQLNSRDEYSASSL